VPTFHRGMELFFVARDTDSRSKAVKICSFTKSEI